MAICCAKMMNDSVLKPFTLKKKMRDSIVWWSNAFGIQIFDLDDHQDFWGFLKLLVINFLIRAIWACFSFKFLFLWLLTLSGFVTSNTVGVCDFKPCQCLWLQTQPGPVRTTKQSLNISCEIAFLTKSLFLMEPFFGKTTFFSVKWLFYGKMTSLLIVFCYVQRKSNISINPLQLSARQHLLL